MPTCRGSDSDGRRHDRPHLETRVVQLFLFQQFLTLFLLTPITGAMAFAAHAIVGEKQARTLEPLLATPITTTELLVAKVLGALLPTLVISLASLGAFVGMIAAFAEPGVLARGSATGGRGCWWCWSARSRRWWRCSWR